MDWIIPLENAAADIDRAGGKGANLGSLIEAGLPVPHGYILTTAAYDEFIHQTEKLPEIESAVAEMTLDDPTSVEQTARTIATLLEKIELPGSIASAILIEYERLGGVPVAVRTSVTTEEDPHLPFAGQGDTLLNVLGDEALLKAVKSCWISVWSTKALAYRARRGVSVDDTHAAVIIQHMFRADTSGIVMTGNPENLNADEMVIRAVRGFGKTVSNDHRIPQEIIFDRHSRTITRQSTQGQLAIMPDQALELARLSERIEYHFGCHQTIEWAWDEDTFCILQSRPIPVSIPPRIRWDPPHPGSTYTRQAIMELLPSPISTLFETCGLPALEQGILNYQTHLGETESTTQGIFETINGFVYQRESSRGRLTYLLSLPKMARAAEHALEHWEHEALPEYQQEVRHLRVDPKSLSPRELANRISSLALAAGRYWAVLAEMMAPLEQAEGRFRGVYARLAKPGDPQPEAFLRGLELRSLQAERALLSATDSSLNTFIEEYGYAIYTFDFAIPLSGEDQSAWRAVVKAWQNGSSPAQERFLRFYGERVAAEDHMQARLNGWQRRIFGPALKAAQRAMQAREDALFELGFAWLPLRRFALELGQRLVTAGALQQPEQIFWLRRNEMFVLASALEEGKARVVSQVAKVQARQSASEAAKSLECPLTIPHDEDMTGAENSSRLQGRGVSPGKITGTARLLRNSSDFEKLQPGEIIVAASIPPAWIPLVGLASSIVTDAGGAHAYCSRAACLIGLPMVMETGHATRVFHDGGIITVDGDEGVVQFAELDSRQ
jgi:rifampicin phosphotransferase